MSAMAPRTRKASAVDVPPQAAKQQLSHEELHVTDDGSYYTPDPANATAAVDTEVLPGGMHAQTLKVTAVRDGTKVMQNAGVDSKVVDLEGPQWMPKKGITYGCTVKFGENGIERFAMIFGKVNASKHSYNKTTSTGELMLLANNLGQDNADDEDWNTPNITITVLTPVPRPSKETHSNVIAQHGKADNFSYDDDRIIPFDLRQNETVLREKLICDLQCLKPILSEIVGDNTSAGAGLKGMTYFSC